MLRQYYFSAQPHVVQTVQKMVPVPSFSGIPNISHNLNLAKSPREQRTYDTRSLYFHWLHIANTVQETVKYCRLRAQDKTQMKQKRKIHIFSSVDPLALVAINILGPLSKMPSGNQQVALSTDFYLQHTSAVCTVRVTYSIFLPYFSTTGC